MVGMALAVALANSGLKVAVIDKATLESRLNPEADGRTSAIALASVRMLDTIGAWPYIAQQAEAILDIRVVDGQTSALVHFDSSKVGHDPFGYIVENGHILKGLYERAATLPHLSIFSPVEVDESERDSYSTRLHLKDGTVIQSPLIVACDGRHSRNRKSANIGSQLISYGQTAIVCTIEHSLPHYGLALERFLPAGPFAALPLTNQRCSLVWTERDEDAPYYLHMTDTRFEEEIRKRLGDYLGEIQVSGKRFAYPLTLMKAERYTAERLALAGDAAHGIHPIAGQGVNLGFRDVAALAEIVIDAARLGLDIGSPALLERYQRWRRFDATSMMAVTDGLNRLFSNHSGLLAFARQSGLRLVQGSDKARHFFMEQAMGLGGKLPKLLQAVPL
jgi:2-octaprenyl-6-methoxyphenol hydroxylase